MRESCALYSTLLSLPLPLSVSPSLTLSFPHHLSLPLSLSLTWTSSPSLPHIHLPSFPPSLPHYCLSLLLSPSHPLTFFLLTSLLSLSLPPSLSLSSTHLPPLSPSSLSLRFLTYIGDLCVSKGMAIQRVQGMVCEVVLKDSNADVLMNLRYLTDHSMR